MDIVYPHDKAEKRRYEKLTYGEFMRMFPEPSPKRLPRPEPLVDKLPGSTRKLLWQPYIARYP